jgi:hypothetical protein
VYVDEVSPRRTKLIGKRAISIKLYPLDSFPPPKTIRLEEQKYRHKNKRCNFLDAAGKISV